ncbi:MAG: prolipoprotein diacylglyceryl transferase [Spirochaetota bacterium]|jgi:phosphatidylglycerol:prolipoprotein diacylglycerol transferase|nr:prolipoprotein diacylglyceryl transferase [Spirochaetota bacterium]
MPNYFPSWLKPEVFAGVNFPPALSFLGVIRWYGVMYIVGLLIFLVLAHYQIRYYKDKLKTLNDERLDNMFFIGVIGLILGGRIFYCLVYDWPYFSRHLTEILIPINSRGQFTGFAGMAYHGAVIGIFVSLATYATVKKIDWREAIDVIFPSTALGYAFGRLGNFINAELYGRITASSVGMIFPDAEKLPLSLPDVQKVLEKLQWQVNEVTGIITTATGDTINGLVGKMMLNNSVVTAINLPRHPSQIYEIFLEGILLFLVMWFITRKYKPLQGYQGTFYICGYAIARFIVEFFRQPDYQFADFSSGKYIGTVAGIFSMGQILSILMFATGILLAVFIKYFYKPKNLPNINEEKPKSKKNK